MSNFNWTKLCPYKVKWRPGGKWLRELTKRGSLGRSTTRRKQIKEKKALKEMLSLFISLIFYTRKPFTWKNYKKWKRASKNRQKYSSRKSLSSSNESDTKTYLDTEPFKVISEADKYQYNFPTKMVKYAT